MVVATTSDSTPESNPPTLFRVQAVHQNGFDVLTSNTASGYSKDNLAPPSPIGFIANVVDGALKLHWNPSPAGDFSAFRLYRGPALDFVPGPENLVSAQSDTGYSTALAYSVFKLSAVDLIGNESSYAMLAASTIVGIDDSPELTLALSAAPNPVRDHARVGFALPSTSTVKLAVFDVAGRVVRELGNGVYPAGRHSVEWSGEGDSGRRLSSGIYYLRLETNAAQLTRRIVVAR